MPVGDELFVQAKLDLKAHQRFVIEKIQEGKEVWNAWRESNTDKLINLSRVDFTAAENRHTNYSEYQFGDNIDFRNATFGDNINFRNAIFGDNIDFSYAIFGDNIDFSYAIFGDNIDFSNANFCDKVSFNEVTFGNHIVFDEATFGDNINFCDTTFGDNIDFRYATFGNRTVFRGMNKGHSFNLSLAKFGDIPEITLRTEDDKIGFNLTDFTCSIDQDVDIDTVSKIQVLRSIADATASINESRDLFILQRKAERSIVWRVWSKGYMPFRYTLKHIQAFIMAFLFSLFSDYGRSVFRPIAWLVGSNIFFFYFYIWLFDHDLSNNETSSLRDFTLTNSLPFGRLLNPAFESSVKTLFTHGGDSIVVPFSIQLAGIAQGLISVVMLFLIGLGIRNYFKIS